VEAVRLDPIKVDNTVELAFKDDTVILLVIILEPKSVEKFCVFEWRVLTWIVDAVIVDPCKVDAVMLITFREEPINEENNVEFALREDTIMVDADRPATKMVDPAMVEKFSEFTMSDDTLIVLPVIVDPKRLDIFS